MHRSSYWKTTAIALVASGASLGADMYLVLPRRHLDALVSAEAAILTIALLAFTVVAGGGLVCLWRDARIGNGRPDPVEQSATRAPVPGLLARMRLRFLLGRSLRPGDLVRVRSRTEIEATLDDAGTLEALPFMPEMQASCGRVFRVHRRVDKINDMRNKTGLRRIRGVVTLTGLRCSGAHHGGCQAQCQILWKDAWLERVAETFVERRRAVHDAAEGTGDPGDRERRYVCQMTRLWEASEPMSRFDIRQDLRPLWLGNVGPRAYLVAMLTRAFNAVQHWRGAVDFPAMPSLGDAKVDARAQPVGEGQKVVVRSREDISRTLRASRTKGLWYDRDMVRYCGRRGVVHRRVQRLIHEGTGQMIVLKTPCTMIEDVVATGEFLRLCPQHEYILWRDAWLLGAQDATASATQAASGEMQG